jgi:hypothetical protein
VAHVDGIKSHEVESLSFFSRPINSKRQTYGYIIFPLDGMILKMLPNAISIYCNSTETIHVPDYSRNIFNWTIFHGPHLT